MQNSCPHRGASMFFGRNEEEGLRCVYHGWKFDVTGACVDMPSEPAESNFRTKVHAVAYPTQERGGIIWAYMGPREVPPPLPDMEANIMTTDPEQISVLLRRCNWMQGLEGELDTIHAAFLHCGAAEFEDQEPKSLAYYHYKERANARFVAKDTDFGTAYGAYRPAEDDTYYWRIGYAFFPFYAMQAAGRDGPGRQDERLRARWTTSTRCSGRSSTAPMVRQRPQRKVPINRGTRAGGQRPRRQLPAPDDRLARPLRPGAEPGQRLLRRPRGADATGSPTPASRACASRTWPSPRPWARSTTARASTSAPRTR